MATAFQRSAFQDNAFQIDVVTDDSTRGTETVLTDRRGVGGHLSKRRYRELNEEWLRETLLANAQYSTDENEDEFIEIILLGAL